jgi:hypothetical protein
MKTGRVHHHYQFQRPMMTMTYVYLSDVGSNKFCHMGYISSCAHMIPEGKGSTVLEFLGEQ